MFKATSKNLQGRRDSGANLRQNGRKSVGPGFVGRRVKEISADQLDKILNKEAERLLARVPIARAPVAGERSTDEKRLLEIRLHQNERQKKFDLREKKSRAKRRTKKSRK